MKTVTITIPEDLDRRAAEEATRRGMSKSALMREGLSALLPPDDSDAETDPWRSLAGFGAEGISVEPGEIDGIVYRG